MGLITGAAIGLDIRPSRSAITSTPMPARPDALHNQVLMDPELLGDIAFAVGGPFHMMYPNRVGRHIGAFHAAFESARVRGTVYYGKKANKAACVVRACAEHSAGVDVSSVGEFASALAGGIRGTDVMVTGPTKSEELLWLAARHGALIAVDSLDELNRLIARPQGEPVWVLLRVQPPGTTSRFGMTDAELSTAVDRLTDCETVSLEGFSFHLSGYEPAPRAALAATLVDRCRAARALGHAASTISIGGGFGVDYLDAGSWAQFNEHVTQDWFQARRSFEEFYPYHCDDPGAEMLTRILDTGTLAELLRTSGIRLAVEPGRALLDGAGCTVFRVQGTKTRTAHGESYSILTVDGTSLSLSEQWFASEYLPDPVLWPLRPTRPGAAVPTCVGASTCLESDMLSWRRIPLSRPAVSGDLLVYPNTAGYQMDSNESAFHELPIPPKVVLHDQGNRFRWTFDTPGKVT